MKNIKDIPKTAWRQISGDQDPGKYGATIARFDESGAVEVLKIDPVLELVSKEEAKKFGYPFRTCKGYYRPEQLQLGAPDVAEAMGYNCVTVEELSEDPELRQLWIAEMLLDYGLSGTEDGPTGWGKDVLPADPVYWRAEEQPQGRDFFDEDDAEFREFLGS